MNFNGTAAVEQGKGITATGTLSAQEEFLQDHFPDFPVLPGVLMIEILRQTAEKYFEQPLRLTAVRNVKYSNFLRPGDVWESRMELAAEEGNASQWKGRLLKEGRAVCSAQLTLVKN